MALAYRLRGLRPSGGTARSTLDILGEGAIVIRDGVPHRALPGGPAVRFAVPDPLVISRYHPARSIDAYLVTPLPRVTGAVLRASARACGSRQVRTALDAALRRFPASNVEHPGQYSVTAITEGHRITATCTDVYGLTAAGIVQVAIALTTTGVSGVRAASEVLGDPRTAAGELGIRIGAPEGLSP